jgi:hypothetical protein
MSSSRSLPTVAREDKKLSGWAEFSVQRKVLLYQCFADFLIEMLQRQRDLHVDRRLML